MIEHERTMVVRMLDEAPDVDGEEMVTVTLRDPRPVAGVPMGPPMGGSGAFTYTVLKSAQPKVGDEKKVIVEDVT